MYVKVAKTAMEIIQAKGITSDTIILLNMVNGEGPYNSSRVSCDLGTQFQLLLITTKMNKDDYTDIIESDLGILYTQPSAKIYLDEQMQIKVGSLNNLILAGEYSGEIDGNMKLIDLR